MRLVMLLCICCINSLCLAQKNKQPTEQEIATAKKYLEKYEEEKVIALSSKSRFVFGYNTSSNKVTVTESSKEELMCIDLSASIPQYKFYNEMSSIDRLQVLYKNQKPYSVRPKDDYYNISDYFYSDARVLYFMLNFPSQGFKYDVSFEKNYKDVKYFTSTYFHTVYPVQRRQLQFVVPRWLEVELKEINFEAYTIEKTSKYDAKQDADIYTFVMEAIPSFIEEESAPGHSHTYPHLLILAKSHEKNGKKQQLFNSTADLYKWYKSLVQEMNDQPELLKEKVHELTEKATSELDKLKAIYYWVQDNIRYIAFEDGIAGFKPEECQKVYENKFGDCKGMANLTKQMLLLAGFDARLTWIGTRRIAYDYSMPNLAVDNHMICTVIMDGKYYFLDPTEKYNAFLDYAERIQNRPALIENGAEYILATVPKMDQKDNQELIKSSLSINGEVLEGTVKQQYQGESKAYLLYQINQLQSDRVNEAIKSYITQGDKNRKISEVSTSDLDNRDQTLTISYQLSQHNAVSSFGDEIYLDIDYYKELGQFEFEDRESDYIFPHKSQLVIETEVAIPEGYQISELPEGIQEQHSDFTFEVNFKNNGNKLLYQKRITIDNAIVRANDFERWNECIRKLNSSYQEQVVFTKKS